MSIAAEKYIQVFLISLLLSSVLTPAVILVARKFKLVAMPREDRWHKEPTALYGGIAIFLAFSIPFSFLIQASPGLMLLLAGGAAFFFIGLLDDIMRFTPQGKFVAQLIAVVLVVGLGLKIHLPGYPIISIGLTVFWLIAMANALNILDNMDGLSSGITLVAALSLATYGYLFNLYEIIGPSLLLAGSCLGFWIYNFKPAKIFMGDCGSLFLGFVLGGLVVVSSSSITNAGTDVYATFSNMILMLAVPVAVLIIPIFDTALVSFTRLQSGRSIAQGGRDHTSHRLVLLGLSEERAVLTLMLVAAVVSAVVLYMAKHSLDAFLSIVSIAAVVSIFFGVFLSYLNSDIYGEDRGKGSRIAHAMKIMLNKRQILQVCIDILLLTVSYFSAYLLKFDGVISPYNKGLIEQTLPLVLAVKITCLWFFGLYRGQWRFASLDDIFKIIKSTILSSAIIVGALVFLYRFEGFSRVVFFMDAILTLIFISGIRFMLRMFNEYFIRQSEKNNSIPILIFGAGDGGDLFLRELRKRKGHDFLPVGFIDDDPAKKGQEIHGVKVLGNRYDLEHLIKRFGIQKVFLAVLSKAPSLHEKVAECCKGLDVDIVQIRPLIQFAQTGDTTPKHAATQHLKVIHSGTRKGIKQ